MVFTSLLEVSQRKSSSCIPILRNDIPLKCHLYCKVRHYDKNPAGIRATHEVALLGLSGTL